MDDHRAAPPLRDESATPGDRRTIRASKFLSKHLRHQPDRVGLRLDAHGWVDIDAVLQAAARHGVALSREELDQIVATNDKQRFAIDGTRIRANQGHSVAIDLDLPAAEPPAQLYHGTVARALTAIRIEGLRPMSRHHVHLSPDRETATRVGARRGRPVVLEVDATGMSRAGHTFSVSANGVWLTDTVPPAFLEIPS